MTVTFRILGEPGVEVDGVFVAPRSRRHRSLIALFALADGHTLQAARAIDCLWPDADRDAARRHLRVLVGQLRDRLGVHRELLVTRDGGYALEGVEVDVDQVRSSLGMGRRLAADGHVHEAADHLEHALRAWRGEPLGGLADEAWLRDSARELAALREEVLLALCDARLDTDRADLAVPLLDIAAASGDASVALVERHARACARMGRLDDAAASCARAIRIAPEQGRAQLQQLQRQVLSQDPAVVGARSSRGAPLPPPPVVSSSFIGRDESIEALRAAIRADTRAVTLLGPGGTGKSRAANELARAMDGAVEAVGWIDLTRVRTSAAIPGLLLGALGITGGGDDPLDAIGQAIGTRRLLLVFDNAEHVVEVAAIVDALLSRCPRLLLVVTSRTVLEADTHEVWLRPLAHDAEAGEQPHSVQLFVDRAAGVDGLVDDSPGTLGAILDVCEAVDHLPLGIELAAARTALLTPRQVLDGLRRRSDLLRTRDPARPERQRSLLGVVAWSYDLLDDDARHVLQSAAAFSGGWTLDDLVAVDGAVDAVAVAEELDRLTAQSLVVAEVRADGTRRWRMLDTIAAFTRPQLDASEDGAERRRRHALRMLEIARSANTHIPSAADDRARLVVELANVHVAIDWAIAHDPELAAEIFGGLRRYYSTVGANAEAIELGTRVMGHPAADGEARLVLGTALHYAGEREQAGRHIIAAVDAAARGGHGSLEVGARLAYAEWLRAGGDMFAAAREISMAKERACGAHARGLVSLALAMHMTEAEAARDRMPVLRDARSLLDGSGDDLAIATVHVQAAIVAALEDDDASAISELERTAEEMEARGFRTYATYVRAAHIRALTEHGCDDELIREFPAWSGRIRQGGDVLNLVFALTSASVPHLRSGHVGTAWSISLEVLEIAERTGILMLLEYPLYVLADLAFANSLPDVTHACLDALDPSLLDRRYRLDAEVEDAVSELIARTGHSPSHAIAQMSAHERVARAVTVVRREPASRFALDLAAPAAVSLDP